MTKSRASSKAGAQPAAGMRSHQRVFDAKQHDPYQAAGKYKEPTVCPDCRAIFHAGHWQWGNAPDGAHQTRCPACRRIHEKLPAGWLTLGGAHFTAHRADVLARLHKVAAREREEHPLNRVMAIEEGPDEVVVTTTDIHTPQRIAEALKRQHHGDFDVQYGHDEYSVRVHWRA
ncbi:MAG: BCAM0308 family protein [Casimicrobiaceae bacterium]